MLAPPMTTPGTRPPEVRSRSSSMSADPDTLTVEGRRPRTTRCEAPVMVSDLTEIAGMRSASSASKTIGLPGVPERSRFRASG